MPRIKGGKAAQPPTYHAESRVKALRLQQGWSQMRLAGLTGTSDDIIRKAERGEILNITTGIMLRIAETLDCSVSDLFPIFAPRLTRPRKTGDWRGGPVPTQFA